MDSKIENRKKIISGRINKKNVHSQNKDSKTITQPEKKQNKSYWLLQSNLLQFDINAYLNKYKGGYLGWPVQVVDDTLESKAKKGDKLFLWRAKGKGKDRGVMDHGEVINNSSLAYINREFPEQDILSNESLWKTNFDLNICQADEDIPENLSNKSIVLVKNNQNFLAHFIKYDVFSVSFSLPKFDGVFPQSGVSKAKALPDTLSQKLQKTRRKGIKEYTKYKCAAPDWNPYTEIDGIARPNTELCKTIPILKRSPSGEITAYSLVPTNRQKYLSTALSDEISSYDASQFPMKSRYGNTLTYKVALECGLETKKKFSTGIVLKLDLNQNPTHVPKIILPLESIRSNKNNIALLNHRIIREKGFPVGSLHDLNDLNVYKQLYSLWLNEITRLSPPLLASSSNRPASSSTFLATTLPELSSSEMEEKKAPKNTKGSVSKKIASKASFSKENEHAHAGKKRKELESKKDNPLQHRDKKKKIFEKSITFFNPPALPEHESVLKEGFFPMFEPAEIETTDYDKAVEFPRQAPKVDKKEESKDARKNTKTNFREQKKPELSQTARNKIGRWGEQLVYNLLKKRYASKYGTEEKCVETTKGFKMAGIHKGSLKHPERKGKSIHLEVEWHNKGLPEGSDDSGADDLVVKKSINGAAYREHHIEVKTTRSAKEGDVEFTRNQWDAMRQEYDHRFKRILIFDKEPSEAELKTANRMIPSIVMQLQTGNFIAYWLHNDKMKKKSLPEKALPLFVRKNIGRLNAQFLKESFDVDLIKGIMLAYNCSQSDRVNPNLFKYSIFRVYRAGIYDVILEPRDKLRKNQFFLYVDDTGTLNYSVLTKTGAKIHQKITKHQLGAHLQSDQYEEICTAIKNKEASKLKPFLEIIFQITSDAGHTEKQLPVIKKMKNPAESILLGTDNPLGISFKI